MTSLRNCHVNPTQNSTKIARNGPSCRFMHKKDLTCIKKTSSLFYAWIDMKARNSSPGIFMRKAIVRTKKDHRVPSNLTSFSLISQCLFCFVFFSCKIRVQIERRSRDKKAVYFILIDKTRAVFLELMLLTTFLFMKYFKILWSEKLQFTGLSLF